MSEKQIREFYDKDFLTIMREIKKKSEVNKTFNLGKKNIIKVALLGTGSLQYFASMLKYGLNMVDVSIEVFIGTYKGAEIDIMDDNLVFGQIKRNGTVYVKDGRSAFNTHKGIAIDILPFYNSPDSRIMFEIQNALCSFFKTMTWAHMGSGSERNWLKRKYYECIAKVSNKKSYQLYYKWANMVKDRKDFLAYLCVRRNPYHRGFNQRKYFENLCEIEFEGHRFPAPQEYDEFLHSSYTIFFLLWHKY